MDGLSTGSGWARDSRANYGGFSVAIPTVSSRISSVERNLGLLVAVGRRQAGEL